jgi:hypothetical protein
LQLRAEQEENLHKELADYGHTEKEVCSMNVPHKEIPLPGGLVAIVDEEDFARASLLSWSTNGRGYVRARLKHSVGGDGRLVYLHHFVIGVPPTGMVIDHIDGNPLNNTRENLQLASQSRNAMRSPKKRGGVTMTDDGRWRARMRVDGKMHSLGCYDTEGEAQHVIDRARELVWTDESINTLGVQL